MTEFKTIYDENIKRVDSLINIYSKIKKDSTTSYKNTDILRAAQVFLHSIFEEYYRSTIKKWLLPKGKKEALNSLMLPSSTGKSLPKFTVYDLFLQCEEKTVTEVMNESIIDAMNKVSFNSFSEICSWGDKIGVEFSKFSKASEIENAISRRHKIVHEADMTPSKERNKLNTINLAQIEKWKEAYIELVDLIEKQVEEW